MKSVTARLLIAFFSISLSNSAISCYYDFTELREYCENDPYLNELVICDYDDADLYNFDWIGCGRMEIQIPNLCYLGHRVPLYQLRVCPGGENEPPRASTAKYQNNTCKAEGSVIRTDNLSVSEVINLVGVDFTLVYSSDRVPGRKTWNKAVIPVTHDLFTAHPSIVSENVKVQIAGRTIHQSFTPQAGIVYNFEWDGLDQNGNPVNGPVTANVSVYEEYTFPTLELTAANFPNIQTMSSSKIKKSLNTSTVNSIYHHTFRTSLVLGSVFPSASIAKGWDLSIRHHYDHLRKTLFMGDGETFNTEALLRSNGEYWIVSPDRSEVFVFDSSYRHKKTLYGLTGFNKYIFNYDTQNRLLSVEDGYGNETTFQYNNFGLESITSAFGHVTSFGLDANGYINSITNPENEAYSLTSTPSGLLQTFTKPSGATSTMTYKSDGSLESDISSGGSEIWLAKYNSGNETIIDQTTALSRLTKYSSSYENGNFTRNVTYPDSTILGYQENLSSVKRTGPGYYNAETSKQSDPRFGSLFWMPNSFILNSSLFQFVSQTTETAVLADPENPFSIISLDRSTVINNSKTTTISYNPNAMSFTRTSPEGRTQVTKINSKEDIISEQVGSYLPLLYTYNTLGNVQKISQGLGRSVEFTYNVNTGFLETLKNALNQIASFTYDLAGRILTQVLPDGRVISYSYDNDGNLASITPPGRPEHGFEYNDFGFVSQYSPPLIQTTNSTSVYNYSNDRELVGILRPDGQSIQFNYNTVTALLDSIYLPNGNRSFTWSNQSLIQSISEDMITRDISVTDNVITQDNFSYSNGYAYLSYGYSSDFLMSHESLNAPGFSEVRYFTHDNDGLLLNDGNLFFVRSPVTGQITQSDQGNLSTFYDYSTDYGELKSIESVFNGNTLYEESWTRDNLGRIQARNEKYGNGVLKSFEYLYDLTGRLKQVKTNGVVTSSYSYDSNSNRISQTVDGVSFNPSSSPENFNLGDSHTCAITAQGVKCWGDGQFLGYGNTTNLGDDESIASVGYVNIGAPVKELTLGNTHTCALTADQSVKCWGKNNYGQLGLGHINHIGDNELPSSQSPVSLNGKVSQIVSGESHTCALKEDNNVICWGLGTFGRLGYGNSNNVGDNELPSSIGNVSTGVTSKILQIVAGKEHTCLLTTSGNVKCWGKNSFFQLGQGTVSDIIGDDELPSSVGFINFGEPVTQITADGDHTCALFENRKIKCWGRNDFGQLGLATTSTLTTSLVNHPYVDVGADVKYVSAGKNSTCVITTNNEAKCWGNNSNGQLGQSHTNTLGDDEHPSSFSTIPLGGPIVAIDGSSNHTCATRNTGELFCWGTSSTGALGLGNTNTIGDNETPLSVGHIPAINQGSILYDSQDRLLNFGTKSYTYDLNGDLESFNDSSSGLTTTFTYDSFGNLKNVVLPNKTISYLVDAHNRRMVKLENNIAVHNYIWNFNNQLVGITDGDGQLVSRFYYGSKSHVPDYMKKNFVDYKIITNHLGSPVAVVEVASGVVIQEIVYDEWGRIISDSNPGFTPFGFAGCLYDVDTKLCRFGARDYDASIGRWLSKDPILFAGGDTNLYGYVMQEPINFIDTNGLVKVPAGAGPTADFLFTWTDSDQGALAGGAAGLGVLALTGNVPGAIAASFFVSNLVNYKYGTNSLDPSSTYKNIKVLDPSQIPSFTPTLKPLPANQRPGVCGPGQ